ncbi:MAG: transcriptional repressor [Bacteroidia bacterium]|nr:transcriptional repressor [Bacteroidia bacterium]MDW8346288.1 transcriptional repressor [Bacteroidia bacterium]
MNVEETLKKAGLRLTNTRKAVLAAFMESQKALSHNDLEQKLNNCDKVTLYRTLSTFLEKDLIHKIINPDGAALFALCKHEPMHSLKEHYQLHNHAHLTCKVCKETRCINDFEVEIPKYLLMNMQIEEVSILLQGTCSNCIKTENRV